MSRMPLSLLLLLPSAALASDNFRAQHADSQHAQRIERAAERAREMSATFWTGSAIPRWSAPCPITAKDARGDGGATSFSFDRGEVFGWAMSVQGSRAAMLDCIVPHEVDHAVRASLLRRPVTRWLDEGCASLWESSRVHADLRRTAWQAVQQGERGGVFECFDASEYPDGFAALSMGARASRANAVLYATSFSLVEYLLRERGQAALLAFQRDARKPSEKLLDHYGATPQRLRLDWREWLLSTAARGLDCEAFGCCQHSASMWQAVAYQAAGSKPELIAFVQPGCPSCVKFKKDVASGAYNDYQVIWVERSARTGWRFDQLDLYLEFRAAQKNLQSQPYPPSEPIAVLTLWLRGSPSHMTGYDPPERVKLWLSRQRPAGPAKVIERPAPERLNVRVTPDKRPEGAAAESKPPPLAESKPAPRIEQPFAPANPAAPPDEAAADAARGAGGAAAIGAGAKAGGIIGPLFGPVGAVAGPLIGAGVGVLATWLRMRRRAGGGSGVPPPSQPAASSTPATLTNDAASVGRGQAEADSPRPLPPRDTSELRQLLQLRRLEGRDPLLDATFGMFAEDEIQAVMDDAQTSGEARSVLMNVVDRARRRVNDAAPLSIKPAKWS